MAPKPSRMILEEAEEALASSADEPSSSPCSWYAYRAPSTSSSSRRASTSAAPCSRRIFRIASITSLR